MAWISVNIAMGSDTSALIAQVREFIAADRGIGQHRTKTLLRKAADEIDALRAENNELKTAIADADPQYRLGDYVSIAQALAILSGIRFASKKLRAERDALKAVLNAQQQVVNEGMDATTVEAFTYLTMRAEQAAFERDALAAKVARVEALAAEYADLQFIEEHGQTIADEIRAALGDPVAQDAKDGK